MSRVHQIERERLMVGSSADLGDRMASRAAQAVNYVLGVIELFLAFRFFLLLLGANSSNAFVSFVYAVSGLFVAPFKGIFSNSVQGVAVFDWATVLAMIVYAVIAYAVVNLIAAAQADDDDVI